MKDRRRDLTTNVGDPTQWKKRDIKHENCTVLQLSRNAKFQAQKCSILSYMTNRGSEVLTLPPLVRLSVCVNDRFSVGG